MFNYLFYFPYPQGLGNWAIFSLDINHAYQEPRVVVAVEFPTWDSMGLGYRRRGSCIVDRGGNFSLQLANGIGKTRMGSLHICLDTLYNYFLFGQRGSRQKLTNKGREMDIGEMRKLIGS